MAADENWGRYVENLRRCTKCILPETFPGIKFDKEGICNYCKEYEPIKVFGEEKLKEILDKYRNKGEKYDCVVPISGGRDSANVLYNIVEKYNMRTIALTIDSGAMLPEAYRNIETITKKLGVEHVYLRDEKQIEISKKNTKIKFHAWLKKPSINTIVPVLNASDKTMNLKIYKFAEKNKIQLVLGGNNIGNSSFEQEHWKTGFMHVFPDNRGNYTEYQKIKLSFLFLYEFLKNYHNYHYSVFKEYFEGSLVYFFESYLKPKNVQNVGFYDYIYWNEKEILENVYKIGWKGAEDATTTWRIDDAAYPLINYIYYNLVGFTEHDEMYSKMIREGQITREEGLKRATADHNSEWIHGKRLLKILEELEVSKEELDDVLKEYRKKFINLKK